MNKQIILGLLLLGGCVDTSREVVLERNIADVIIQDTQRCNKVKLHYDSDGNLWLGKAK